MFAGSLVIELKGRIAMHVEQKGGKETAGTEERRNTVSVKDYTFHDSPARVEMVKADGAITRDYQKREGWKRIGSMFIG